MNETETRSHDKHEFPCVEAWNEEKKELCENFKEEISNTDNSPTELSTPENKLNSKLFEESLHYYKTYNNRRLSDLFPCGKQPAPDSTSTTSTKHKLSKCLPLLLIQGLTKNHVSEKDISKKEREKKVLNILPSLLTVLKQAINTPSEVQTLEYCQTVLEEATAGVDAETVVYYFVKKLLFNDPLLRHAAIALLCSYCSGRRFKIVLASNLLKNVISLFCDDNLKALELSWKTVNAVIQNLKFVDQVKIVSDVCLAVKCADFHSSNKKYIPGLCHSEGFDSIFPLYEKVMLKGIMKDKRRAAQALRQLIRFSSEDALQPSLCSVVGVLLCVILKFKDEPCTQTKIALIETLTTLVAKVGIKLKIYFLRIQMTFLTTMKCSSRNLQLQCIRGLCCLVHFKSPHFVALYEYLFNSIKKEVCTTKKIMLFALRCVIKCACVSIPESSRQKILILVLSMLDYQNHPCRITAAGCIGTIVGFLPQMEFEKVLKLYILGEDKSASWSLRHSQCTALMVALKESPAKLLLQEELSEKISESILNFMKADKVDIILSGLKACGYFMLFKLTLLEEKIDYSILVLFCEAMNHKSEDVKCTFALVANYIANQIALPLYVTKEIVPQLVKGTKNECNKVRSSCEFALVAVLNLYNQDKFAQMYVNTLETGAQESFQDELANLKEIVKQPKPKEVELDFTVM